MKTLIISAFAAAALATAASTANASLEAAAGCPTWACGTPGNGTRLTGVVSKGAVAQPVSAVILPSGEVVGLR